MTIVRIIHTTFPADQAEKAERNWRDHCGPLMLRQPGCRSEVLLRNQENPGGYVSYSEWDDQESVQRYLESDDHREIKRHNRNMSGLRS